MLNLERNFGVQKMASYLHHTATTIYLCCVPALEDSTGASCVGLAAANIQLFLILPLKKCQNLCNISKSLTTNQLYLIFIKKHQKEFNIFVSINLIITKHGNPSKLYRNYSKQRQNVLWIILRHIFHSFNTICLCT